MLGTRYLNKQTNTELQTQQRLNREQTQKASEQDRWDKLTNISDNKMGRARH